MGSGVGTAATKATLGGFKLPVGVVVMGDNVGLWVGPFVDTRLVVVGVALGADVGVLGAAVGEEETGVNVGASVRVVGVSVVGANVAPPTFVLQWLESCT